MKKQLLSLVALAVAFAAGSQNISTIAGNGTTGYTGDGGQATAAEMDHPYGVCVDNSGNIYIADEWNQVVRKVSTSGVITTVAGTGTGSFTGDGGPATKASLYYPSQVYVDAAGNIFIADYFNSCIRKVNTTGTISTVAGKGGLAGFAGDGGQATAAKLNYPTDLTFDASGNMYIADYTNQRIRKVNTSGIISTYAGTGTAGFSGDGGNATAAEINYPYGVAVDSKGNVYVGDNYNNRIRKIDVTGKITTFVGNGTAGFSGDGGNATAAELNSPYMISIDANDNLYIADFSNSRIRFVNAFTSVISTVAGNGTAGFSGDGGPATAAEISGAGVFADPNTNTVYVGDHANMRIRKFTFSPMDVNNTATAQAELNIYPNPSNGTFNLTIGNGQSGMNGRMEVYNMLGAKVYSAQLITHNSSRIIDLSGQPNGIYVVKVQTEDGSTLVKRIEITR